MTAAAIGYVRVSSEQQAGEKQTSLQDQRAAILALAERLGVQVSQFFEDAGFSGATVAKRPALRELIGYCEQHPQSATAPGFVLVLNDSRFGRFDDPDQAAHLRFSLKTSGWLVRFCEADEIADPSLRHIMRAVGGAQASEYRRNLRANSTRGKIGTTKQGYWGNREPFGYRRAVVYPPAQARVLAAGVPKARGEKIKLVPGPQVEVEIVQELFRRYVLEGMSMRALCRWLNSRPDATLARAQWFGTSVRGMLENWAYVGCVAGRMRTAERLERGDWAKRAPEYLVEGAHEPLVDRALFDRAQELLKGLPPRGHVHDYRVRGLVTCPDCGEPFVGGGLGGRVMRGRPERTRFYVDRGGRDGKCSTPITCVAAHLLEPAIIDAFATHVEAQLHAETIARAMQERTAAVSAPQRGASLQKRRADVVRRRERLLALVEAGDVKMDEVRERLQALREELARTEREQVVVEEEATVRAKLEQLVTCARDLRRVATEATGPELRTLLHPWIETMTFNRRTRALTMTMRTLTGVLLPQPLRAGGRRKQTPLTVTVQVTVSPSYSVTLAARRHA